MSASPTPGRESGDRCPGALRLHAADDGALARVRLPGGLLTSHQAEVLAGLAEELGDGRLDLTSRGNVQLRGLPDGCGAALGGRLRAAGLLPSDRHERIRNVVASPLCGLDGPAGPRDARADVADVDVDVAVDVQAWARALDALLCADRAEQQTEAEAETSDLSGLSGRFLFGLDDGRGDIAALAPDVTLIAERDGRHALLCFGTTGPALRLAVGDAPRAAVLAARAFLAAVRAGGVKAWRVRELTPEQRPSPERLAERLAAAGIACSLVPHVSLVPRVTLPHGPAPQLGLVEGRDGRWALSLAAPLGRLTAGQWRLLARAAGRDGDGELRVTPWRGIVVPGLTARAAAAHRAAFADAGLVVSSGSPWHGAGACAGRPGCAKSLADVRADAAACLTGTLPGGAGALPVYWSGCERRCGHPGGRWVDVLATDEGYRLAVRDDAARPAPTRTVPARPVPARELADAVAAARTTT
ncbi:nitrite/sulfite reductase [Streptomyces griseocarneus]|uniref:nitrite/sulfite reductase n=1 Tax=Streptomyces griseocarneus TaxID=51201 RepID=UPI001CC900B4|nr:nitrite/sulfite reductase [Streptomyces griseocarneus]MBZ6474815.1 nitrite/sulfite reductase [Streptomyces griseocarneus]